MLINMFHRISYQSGWRKIYRFSVPIIVIGNLTMGGNGKTPMVIWLVEKLKYRGWKVAVISRGYKGKSKNYPIVLSSNSSSCECGDEPVLIRRRTGVLVSVSPKRVDAIFALLRIQPSLDIIISDDGLQHYSLFRDIEWIVINGMLRFGNGYCLPAGPMRERMVRLHQAHAVIINGSTEDILQPKEILMQLLPIFIINMLTGERRPLNFLKKVVAIAGIGYPMQFFITLKKNGIFPIKEIFFADHQIYSELMLMSIVNIDETLLMTEKDAIKCLHFAHKNWWYLHTDVKINATNELNLLDMVEEKIKYYKNNNYNSV